jgi:hypothetical protein
MPEPGCGYLRGLVQHLIDHFPGYVFDRSGQCIKCALTNDEMPNALHARDPESERRGIQRQSACASERATNISFMSTPRAWVETSVQKCQR